MNTKEQAQLETVQAAMEATEHLDRPEELQRTWERLLTWPPLEMVEESLAAELR